MIVQSESVFHEDVKMTDPVRSQCSCRIKVFKGIVSEFKDASSVRLI